MLRALLIGLVVLGGAAAVAFFNVPALQEPLIFRTIAAHMQADRTALMKDDSLRVAVCGSGSPLPDRARAEPCFLVIAGGRMIMVDAGSGGWSTVARWPVPPRALEGVFLTHFHSDHIADLPVANMQSWVDGRPAPLSVYGGPGIERVVAGFNEAFALDSSYRSAHHGAAFMPIALATMQGQVVAAPDGASLSGEQQAIAYDKDGLTVTAFAVEHAPISPAYGYRVTYKDRSVVFTGDTARAASVIAAARGADVLIHEAVDKPLIARMGQEAEAAGRDRLAKVMNDIQSYHATQAEAVQVGRDAGVKLVVLNHLVPPLPEWLGDRYALRNIVGEAPPVRVAVDSMLITLPLNSKAVTVTRIGDD